MKPDCSPEELLLRLLGLFFGLSQLHKFDFLDAFVIV
jgi:hypothetical protein